MKVAIPHFGDQIAPGFEATAAITIFTIRKSKVVDETRFSLQSREALDRIVNPMLNPIRRVIPPLGGLDLSPIVLLILVQVLGSVLTNFLLAL